MSRTLLVATLLIGGQAVVCSDINDATFTEICDKPAALAAYYGPKLLLPADTKALEEKILAQNSNYTKHSLPASIKDDGGLFVSSPYVNRSLGGGEKLSEVCLLFVTGGTAYTVAKAFERAKGYADESSRRSVIDAAIREADRHCLTHAKDFYSAESKKESRSAID